MMCEIVVRVDPSWPAGSGVLEGRVNGQKLFGWLAEDELTRWLQKRGGSISETGNGERMALADLTQAEYKKSLWGQR